MFAPQIPPPRTRLFQTLFAAMGVGVALLVAVLLFGPHGARYTLGPDALVVDATTAGWTSHKSWPRAGIHARQAAIHGAVRVGGTAMPGWCTGWFRVADLGTAWLATNCGNDVVVVDAPQPVLLTPAEPARFVAALDGSGEGVFAMAPGASGGPGWLVFRLSIVLLVGMGLPLVALAPRTLAYEVRDRSLVVKKLSGAKSFALAGTRVTTTTPAWGMRLWGTGMPGYRAGWYRIDGKATRVYTTGRGPGLLIEGASLRVFVTPADLDGMRAALEREGAELA
jgi:hypothetical protein